jgi:hypothetical protein
LGVDCGGAWCSVADWFVVAGLSGGIPQMSQ